MATCTASSTATAALGLPAMKAQVGRVDSVSVRMLGGARRAWEVKTMAGRGGAARVRCGAIPLPTPLVISASTATLLFLGRFVFLPFQRKQVASQGLPVQNGVTHFEAGDTRAAEISSLLQTKDPAGFTLIDVLGWGALGHAIGFFILATASNGYDPQF